MAEVQRVGSLEVDQDIAFTLREWKVERLGWALFGIALLAAFAGLFGGAGPLAIAEVQSNDNKLQLQYSLITRLAGVPQFTVKVDPSLASGGVLTLSISTKLTETLKVEQIEPEPDSTILAGELQHYQFKVDPGAVEPLQVRFGFKPDKAGLNAGEVGVVGGPSIFIRQFIWP
jgi:hypothetical protein